MLMKWFDLMSGDVVKFTKEFIGRWSSFCNNFKEENLVIEKCYFPFDDNYMNINFKGYDKNYIVVILNNGKWPYYNEQVLEIVELAKEN